MSIRSGFWNSNGSDVREYYNSDFSRLLNLLVRDGIHMTYGEHFMVEANTGMSVIVKPGEAWFNSTWIQNDADYPITIPSAPVIAGYKRIDSIVIKIDSSDNVRLATIECVSGEPGSNPTPPSLPNTTTVKYHKIADVSVATGQTSITTANITTYVGTDTAPYISGILQTVSASSLLLQWNAQFINFMTTNENEWQTMVTQKSNEFEEWMTASENDFETWQDGETTNYSIWLDSKQAGFEEWFQYLQDQLDDNQAGHLQNQILDIVNGALCTANEF